MPEPQAAPPNLGRYKDPVMLGSGGMGAVYRAVDPMLDRYVAIKVLTHREPRYVERFRREAQVLAKIMHPSIIQIYEIVGTDEDQSDPYIVMEFFEGQPLDSALKRGPLPQAVVVSILRQSAEGLKKAHANNVIHRDIKPANIMLADNGDVKILDFGIAKMKDAKKDLTGQTVLGTPYYMSPEQAMGHPIDNRTDIYSLGITAFHLLTGKKPFEAKSKVDVMLMQVKNPLPDISKYVEVDPRVQQIVEKMATKQAAERFQSCDDLIEALDLLPRRLGGRQDDGTGRMKLSQPPGGNTSEVSVNTGRRQLETGRRNVNDSGPGNTARRTVASDGLQRTPPRPGLAPQKPPTIPPQKPPQQTQQRKTIPPGGMQAPAAHKPNRSVLIGVIAGVAVLAVAGAGAYFFLRKSAGPATGKVPTRGWVKQGDLKKVQKPGGYGNCVFSAREIGAADDDSGIQTSFTGSDSIFGRCFFPKRVGSNKRGEIYEELWIDGARKAQIAFDSVPGDDDSIPVALSQQHDQRLTDLPSGKHTLDVWIYRQTADADAPQPLAAGELVVRK